MSNIYDTHVDNIGRCWRYASSWPPTDLVSAICTYNTMVEPASVAGLIERLLSDIKLLEMNIEALTNKLNEKVE